MTHLKTLVGICAVIGVFSAVTPASATVLTSGGAQVPAGTAVKAELVGSSEWTDTYGGVMQCAGSTIEGETLNTGSSTETVKIGINRLTFEMCGGGCSVRVLKTGTWELHTDGVVANGNGTLTANGQEFTLEWQNWECFGFPGIKGLHCIWSTSNSDYGTVIGGSPATIQVQTTTLRVGGYSGFYCGPSGTFTATYKITAPSELFVD